MKCLILFSWKNKKNINLSSAEFAQRVVEVTCSNSMFDFTTNESNRGNYSKGV